MKYIIYLLLLSLTSVFAAPLGNCLNGRAVPFVNFPASGGQCGLPVPAATAANPVYRASINQALYFNGTSCGSCYELTGPLGIINVVIVDMCASYNNRCGGDRANFIVEQAGFDKIANGSTTDIIYDLGYRAVTCPYSDGIDVSAYIYPGSTNSFFRVAFYDSRYPIDLVAIQGYGMGHFESLTRDNTGGSGTFSWNQRSGGTLLQFPVQFSIVSNSTNQVLFYTVSSANSWTNNSATIDFTNTQFTDVVNTNSTCPQAQPPALIYNDGVLGYGWDVQQGSYNNAYINVTYPGSQFAGVSYALQAGMYSYSGVQFTRLGGFNAGYFQNLTFSIYTDHESAFQILVFFTADTPLSSSGQTISVTNTPQTFTFDVSQLAANQSTIYAVAFQINQNVDNQRDNVTVPIQVFYSNIVWGVNVVNPQSIIPPVADSGSTPVLNTTSGTSTTGGSTPIVTYTTNGGFSFSDSEAPTSTGQTLTTSPTANTNTNGNANTNGNPASGTTNTNTNTNGKTSYASPAVVSSLFVVIAAFLLALF